MNNENENLNMSNFIKNIMIEPKNRYFSIIKQIYNYLIEYLPLINVLNIKKQNNNFNDIIYEISKYIEYKKISAGKYIKNFHSEDNFFYLIMNGSFVELTIMSEKLFITTKEYFTYLIKLQQNKENILLKHTILLNIKTFPININDNLLELSIKNNIFSEDELNILLLEIKINKDKTKIENYLNYIKIKINNKFSSECKFHAIIPFYKIKNYLNEGDTIDTLTYPKHIKSLNGFLCLKKSELLFINKIGIENKEFWKVLKNNNFNILSEIFSNLHLFDGYNMSFFINNFFPYFQLQKYKKGDIIINENYLNIGLYFVINGTFKVKTKKNYYELNELIEMLKHSLDDFSNYLSKLKFINNIKKFNKNDIQDPIINDKLFIKKLNEQREIILSFISGNKILGLNEFYNYKTQYYHLTLEVISNEANVFFLPKTLSTSLINSFDSLNKKFAELIENKTKFYIKFIQNYLINFENEISKIIKLKNNLKIRKLNINKNNNLKIRPLTQEKLKNNFTNNDFMINYKIIRNKILTNNNNNNNINLKSSFSMKHFKTNFKQDKLKTRMEEIINSYKNKKLNKSLSYFNFKKKPKIIFHKSEINFNKIKKYI